MMGLSLFVHSQKRLKKHDANFPARSLFLVSFWPGSWQGPVREDWTDGKADTENRNEASES
jgi:hypothetical protein